MKSPRRCSFWPPMTPVLSRASNYSLMVAERKSKSYASLACVAGGRLSAWETVLAPANGGSMVNAMTQLARTLDARHAVSTTTIHAKAAEALRYIVEAIRFGRVLLAI